MVPVFVVWRRVEIGIQEQYVEVIEHGEPLQFPDLEAVEVSYSNPGLEKQKRGRDRGRRRCGLERTKGWRALKHRYCYSPCKDDGYQ